MGKFDGTYIRELREKKGLSQADVAKLLSLKTAQSISNIERGVSPLPRAKIKRMADIFGVKKGEIVTVVMREVQDRVARAANDDPRRLSLARRPAGPELRRRGAAPGHLHPAVPAVPAVLSAFLSAYSASQWSVGSPRPPPADSLTHPRGRGRV